jgi:hypothetical protein
LTEGLLIYMEEEQVGAVAQDLARPVSFCRWVHDLASPGLLRMLQRSWQETLEKASAPLRFAPEEGPMFFAKYGWKPIDVRTLLKAAARLGRLPFWLRLMAMLPEQNGKQGKRPWGGICLQGRG